MSDQLIDKIVDRQQVESDKDYVDKVLDDIFTKFEKVSELKINLATDSSFAKATDTIAKTKKLQDDLSLSIAAYNKLLDDTAKAQAKLSSNTSQQAQDAANVKNALAGQNKELQLNAAYQNAANGSIDQAKAFVASLIAERNRLSSTDENYKDKVFDLNQEIDRQNAFIRENSSALERQKINIGNYIGAIDVLRPALGQATSALETLKIQGKENTAQYASLQTEVNLLTTVLEKNEAGFKSVNTELRANQQALQAMRAAGLEGTEAFEKLRAVVNKAQDEFNDFREAQKLLAQSPFEATVQASVEALQGLAGIYGATVAAQSLFGKENEDLTKSMQKLQAVLVLLTSLQQASALVGKSEAIVAGLQTAGRAALSAITTVYTFVTSAATAATVAFRAALAVTGIGGVVILLASFVNELLKASNGTKAATDRLIAYNNVLKDFYDTLRDGNEDYVKYIGLEKQALEDQLGILSAQGAQFRELQALKVQIAKQDAIDGQAGLDNLGLTKSDVEELQDSYVRLGIELQAYQDIRQKAARAAQQRGEDPADDRAVKNADALIKSLQASRTALKAQIDPAQKFVDKIDDATQKTKELTAETAKYNKQQQDNNTFSIAQAKYTAIAEANARIVSDERKTEDERLSAIREGADARIAIEVASLKRQNSEPGLSDEQQQINARDTATKINAIKAQARADDLGLTKKYNEAEYQFRLDILKQEANAQITRDQLIIDNDKETEDKRLKANADAYNARRALATADLFNTLHDQTTTESQRKDAFAKFDNDVLNADIAFNQTRRDIFKQTGEKLLQDGIDATNRIVLGIRQQYNAAVRALQEAREKGQLTASQLDRQTGALSDNVDLQEAQAAVTIAFLKVNATKEGTKERLDAETELADKVKALQDTDLKRFEDTEKRKQEAVQETVDTISQYYEKAVEVVGKFLDAQTTGEKNALQDQINQVKEKSDAQVAAEQNTLDSTQEKADKTATIQANAQAQTDALQRKQKQLDIQQAQFNKIKAEGEIILSTATAIAADLKNPAKIPFDIAVGAAELAIAIAAPVPTYFEGTGHHPGGPMIVGDGGRKEVVVSDGRAYITPDIPTYIADAPPGTVVYPDARKFLANMPDGVLYSSGGSQASAADYAMLKELKGLKKAIEDKEELHINPNFNSIMAIHKYGNSFVQYVKDHVQF